MPGELCELWEQALRSVIETKQHRSIEFAHHGPGGVRHYATRLVPEIGPSGEVESVLGVTQDVTDRKCAEEALREADGARTNSWPPSPTSSGTRSLPSGPASTCSA